MIPGLVAVVPVLGMTREKVSARLNGRTKVASNGGRRGRAGDVGRRGGTGKAQKNQRPLRGGGAMMVVFAFTRCRVGADAPWPR